MKTFIFIAMVSVSCGQSTAPKKTVKVVPVAGPNDCKTEPNGDKIWYPDMGTFYPEGRRIMFDTWPALCKAGKWIMDDEEAIRINTELHIKWDLIRAAKTRPLTLQETKVLLAYGSSIFTRDGEIFRQEEIDARFAQLLLGQKLIQEAAMREEKK